MKFMSEIRMAFTFQNLCEMFTRIQQSFCDEIYGRALK